MVNSRRLKQALPFLLVVLLTAFIIIDLVSGPIGLKQQIHASDVFQILASHLGLVHRQSSETVRASDFIVWELRTPRVLAGLVVGMLLAMAGVAFQSFLMNPLADPYMIGVSAGSALGSATIILIGGTGWLIGLAQPVAAFASGIATMALISLLARRNGRVSAQTFLLAGFVVGTFVYSITRLLIALSNRGNDTSKASAILSQLLGSLQTAHWTDIWLMAPFGIVGAIVLMKSHSELNLMTLGEESAAHLGVDTERFKARVIIAGSMVTAATVAVAGIIGFVGMVVPHLARRIVGPDHRRLLPCSMLLGAAVLLIADWFSRVCLNELEVGVITSIVGAPVFCYLLRTKLVSRW